MNVYIEYQCEGFHGVVGPFASRREADRWAHEQTPHESEWQRALVLSPQAAEIAIARSA